MTNVPLAKMAAFGCILIGNASTFLQVGYWRFLWFNIWRLSQ